MGQMIGYLLLLWGFVTAIAILPPEWVGDKTPGLLRQMAPRLELGVETADGLLDKGFSWFTETMEFAPAKPFFSRGAEGVTITHAHVAWIFTIIIVILMYVVWARTRASASPLDDLLIIPVFYLGWQIITRILQATGLPGGKYLTHAYAFPVFFGMLSLSLLGRRRRWEDARVLLLTGLVCLIFIAGPMTKGIARGLEAIAALREKNSVALFTGLGVGLLALVAASTLGLPPERGRR